MSRMSPQEFAKQIGAGLLSFPVTHLQPGCKLVRRARVSRAPGLAAGAQAGGAVCGGTGEFRSLTLEEFSAVVKAAVEQTQGRVPVVAGCGYGTAMAKQFARAGEAAGADGILLLPPYLLNADPAGLVAHVEAVCAATKLGVIFYNRDNAILNEVWLEKLCARCPNLVWFQGRIWRY